MLGRCHIIYPLFQGKVSCYGQVIGWDSWFVLVASFPLSLYLSLPTESDNQGLGRMWGSDWRWNLSGCEQLCSRVQKKDVDGLEREWMQLLSDGGKAGGRVVRCGNDKPWESYTVPGGGISPCWEGTPASDLQATLLYYYFFSGAILYLFTKTSCQILRHKDSMYKLNVPHNNYIIMFLYRLFFKLIKLNLWHYSFEKPRPTEAAAA